MNIKEIALNVAKQMRESVYPNPYISEAAAIDFAEALVAELAKENKPVAWCVGYYSTRHDRIHSNPTMYKPEVEALVLATDPSFELSVCDLYTIPPTAEQLEQETAEACAKVYLNTYDLTDIADDIRSGAWKEYK